MTVKLTKAQKIKILNSNDIFDVMREVLLRESKIDRNKEHLWVVCLANNNRLLNIELVGLGTTNALLVEPVDVFSLALHKQSSKLILVHNHPSGEMRASMGDIHTTERMVAVGEFLKIPVIEHLIISTDNYFSFVDHGILEKIKEEKKYDLTFGQIDDLTKKLQGLNKRLKGIEAAKAKTIATELLKNGIDPKVIAKSTGLTVKQVKALR